MWTNMSYSNRELVDFYISYKLSQRKCSKSLLSSEAAGETTEKPKSAAMNGLLVTSKDECRGDVVAVKSALKDTADEFEHLYMQSFSHLSLQLNITPDTVYHSFKSVLDELFKNGINWGRVVGLFAFGGVLCVQCVERNMSELVPRIAGWMTVYLDEQISPWIESHGGWDSFAEIYGQDAAAEGRRFQESLKKWFLLTGVTLLAAGLLLSVLIKKH